MQMMFPLWSKSEREMKRMDWKKTIDWLTHPVRSDKRMQIQTFLCSDQNQTQVRVAWLLYRVSSIMGAKVFTIEPIRDAFPKYTSLANTKTITDELDNILPNTKTQKKRKASCV
jgi:hypothetical protein